MDQPNPKRDVVNRDADAFQRQLEAQEAFQKEMTEKYKGQIAEINQQFGKGKEFTFTFAKSEGRGRNSLGDYLIVKQPGRDTAVASVRFRDPTPEAMYKLVVSDIISTYELGKYVDQKNNEYKGVIKNLTDAYPGKPVNVQFQRPEAGVPGHFLVTVGDGPNRVVATTETEDETGKPVPLAQQEEKIKESIRRQTPRQG